MKPYFAYVVRNNPATKPWFIRQDVPGGCRFWNKPRGLWLDRDTMLEFPRARISTFRTWEAAQFEADSINAGTSRPTIEPKTY